jgi:nondiscriminating glutamyl-tRNA synthetase
VDSVRDHLDLLSEAAPALRIYLRQPQPRSPEADRLLREVSAQKVVRAFAAELAGRSELDEAGFTRIIAELKKKLVLQDGALLMPIRAALTGEVQGPELKRAAVLLGREEILRRLERVLLSIGGT